MAKKSASKSNLRAAGLFFNIICVFVICSLYFDCRQLDSISPELVDALNDVWDKQLSMLDWDEVSAEDIKSQFCFVIFVMCAYVVCKYLSCVVELNVLQ